MKNNEAKNLKKNNIPFILLFLLGAVILLYPAISDIYYTVEADKEIKEVQKEIDELPEEEINKRMELARAYNSTLDPGKIQDPYTEEEKKGIAEYARMLEVRQKIGRVEIPKIDQNILIYAGTSEDVLQIGAGHLEGTSLPVGGESTHTVITAHRGLPKMKLFRDLNRLEIGDRFYIHNINETLCYEVDQILTVEPTDFKPILVEEGKDYATLLTCTPYMVNSHRLLVRGHRVPYAPLDDYKLSQNGINYGDLLPLAIILMVAMIFLGVWTRRKVRESQERLNECKRKLPYEEEYGQV